MKRCCYYGKTCGMGYSKLAALLFKKGACVDIANRRKAAVA